MEDGFLKLSRKFFSNELWNAAREFSECEAWLDLLQSARFEASGEAYSELIGGREISYSRGQYPASVSFLKKRWGWKTEKKVRCFLDKLKRKGMIITDSSQGMNVITICKYEEYNPAFSDKGKGNGNPKGNSEGKESYVSTSDLQVFGANLTAGVRAEVGAMLEELMQNVSNLGQAKGNNKKKEEEYNNILQDKETSTNVEAKKAEQSKKLAAAKAATLKRRDNFYQSLVPYVERYGKEMIRAFFDYWSELNKSETKMRFETNKTWEVTKRLATWANREKFNGKSTNSVSATGTYTGGRITQDKAASRQSLEDLADAILGEH